MEKKVFKGIIEIGFEGRIEMELIGDEELIKRFTRDCPYHIIY